MASLVHRSLVHKWELHPIFSQRQQFLAGIRQWTKYDIVVCSSTGVRAGLVIVRVAIRAWASMFKKQGIHGWSTCLGRSIPLTATKSRVTKRFTSASTRHRTLAACRGGQPQFLRTRAIQVNQAPRRATTSACHFLRDNQHR